MNLRPATPDDVETLAHIHVTAWQETYAGMLPAEVIAAQTIAKRTSFWRMSLSENLGRVWLLDDTGFAHFGPQRTRRWLAQGYPEELYAIYLLSTAYGNGTKLLKASHGRDGRPFTANVLTGNKRACAFYDKTGGRILITCKDRVGNVVVDEHVYGWRSLEPRKNQDHSRDLSPI
ncbi:hypothetical protein SLH49_01665 [Cognatiyoonia sp. IB215446]|uniref:GNAT family N-acetyltransferase n=1 Tax=Cognatiyoonia sp. IB215446 TaxID=3097355 RepID=UPI002A0FD430|nr:hypothetical protein [Cognatiyoonia sp. IB215446]MDX8346680.1 hypothetical protein [Cognatiyoonia sp. IB215446]